MSDFKAEVRSRTAALADNRSLREAALAFLRESVGPKYSYNFHWLDRPIIQYPQDIVAMQELIWKLRPDLVIETGIAHGGSLVCYASMLALMDLCDAIEAGETSVDPSDSRRRVLGIDCDLRRHNRRALDAHPMRSRIEVIEGSSTDASVVERVRGIAAQAERTLVCLDSDHSHRHVLAELEAYAPLVTVGSYCVVFDTLIDDLPADAHPDRPWGPGSNPKTAAREFLDGHPEFECDRAISDRLAISAAGGGYLRRVR